MKKTIISGGLLALLLVLLIGWGSYHKAFPMKSAVADKSRNIESTNIETTTSSPVSNKNNDETEAPVINEMTVLVNKQHALPDKLQKPTDLVEPNVQFIFKEHNEKRELRKEAADALEALFLGAKEDGITLLGVSGYRSYETQKNVFDSYVRKDGEEKAMTYSALPGYSEHETGLAIDVTGGNGKCAATDCFAGTKEAIWLADHAPEYGFIIRYPEGKEDITGYKYEPWHLRYVGKDVALDIDKRDITLEEYMNAVPVNK